MKTSPKQFVLFCLSLLSFLILSISISATEIKADTIIPIRLDFKNQYLVKTEDGCVFLTNDLFTSNRTILSEKANFLSEEYFITTDNEYSYLGHRGSEIFCDVSKSESNNTDIIQSCTAEEATYSSTYLLYHDGELRTAKKDKFIMGNVREMGCFREYLWAITNDNMLYIGHKVNAPEDMIFLSNNVYKYENCMIVDYNGLVSYYNPHGSDYAISLCKIDNLDNTLELWQWNYEYYACIQTSKSSTSASTTTHIIYEAESGKKITSFQNAKQIAYNTGRYIAEISNDYNHANIYTMSDLTKNKKNPIKFSTPYNFSRIEVVDTITPLFLFFDENDVLRAYLNNDSETQKTAKFETVGSLKSIITVDENGYYLGKYYQALLVLINTNGEVYLTDTTFGQLKKTTINDKIFNIEIDGKKLELKAEIQNRNGRTMYPFRECLEALGVTVSWNSIDRIAIGSVAGITVEFPIDKNIYYINGVEHKMDTYSYISTSGKTYIPLRYAAEAFKYQVKWVPGSIQNNVIIEKLK